MLYNIPSGVIELAEGVSTSTAVLPGGTMQGINDDQLPGYSGACPPPSIVPYPSGIIGRKVPEPAHRYYFRLYALDSELELEPGATEAEVVSAMKGHILAQADTVGKYTTALGLSFKQGAGFLKTTGAGTQTPGDGDTPNVERIYNSLGDPITPTPVVGR